VKVHDQLTISGSQDRPHEGRRVPSTPDRNQTAEWDGNSHTGRDVWNQGNPKKCVPALGILVPECMSNGRLRSVAVLALRLAPRGADSMNNLIEIVTERHR